MSGIKVDMELENLKKKYAGLEHLGIKLPEIKEEKPEDDTTPIMVHKYILEVTVYPNGNTYLKHYPIGETRKAFGGKKGKTKKRIKAEVAKVGREEEY